MFERKFVRLAGIFLLSLYVTYFIEGHAFVHHHHFEDKIVFHSHPYTNSNHSHSATQLLTIDQLLSDTCLPVHYPYLFVAEILPSVLICVPVRSAVLVSEIGSIQLRAPPTL